MKATKKLVSLFLAVMMAISCLTMPAMAAGDEIMRRPPADPECAYCGMPMTRSGVDNGHTIYKCGNADCKNFGIPVYY